MQRRFFRGLPLFVLTLGVFGADSPVKPARAPVADYLNKEMPKWLRFSGEERARAENWGGLGYRQDASQQFVLNRLRLNLQVTPSRWLKFSFQGQDARAWAAAKPAPIAQRDSLDLRLAYVDLGDIEKAPVILRVGRQGLAFGEGRLVAEPNWSNTGRTFDGVRATFGRGKLRLDAFSASVVRFRDGDFNRRLGGDSFHGLYGSFAGVVPQSTIEPYLFCKLAPIAIAESGGRGTLDSKTAGVRWVGKLPVGFDYGAEVASRGGSQAGDRISAWASHFVLGHTFPDARRRPRLFGEYNYRFR